MSNQPIALSVIIPTWRGIRQLPQCLAALLPQLPESAEVLLVDNGSTDGTAGYAASLPPPLRYIRLPQNLGFAGGVNVGLRAARGELLLLLNDDAFVEPGCISALLNTAARWPEIGALAGVLTVLQRPKLLASGGIAIRQNGAAVEIWVGRSVEDLPAQPVEVFGASGALALYRRELLDDIGLLDQGYQSYLEDADLAWRARLRGWRCAVVPDARARHIYSASGGQGSGFKDRLLARNRIRLLVRCWPTPLLQRQLPAIVAYDLQALLYGAVRRRPQIIAGRIEALRELPALRAQRQVIQARRTASIAELSSWLLPAPFPWQELRQRQQLNRLLQAPVSGSS